MSYIEDSMTKVGYKVRVIEKEDIVVMGYTHVFPKEPEENDTEPNFIELLKKDGRFDKLFRIKGNNPMMGLGSWDPECEPGGMRYTLCVEKSSDGNSNLLLEDKDYFEKAIGSSLWLCFEVPQTDDRFWKDNPYAMLKKLGYSFHTGSFDVGLHFDVFPDDYDRVSNSAYEFWITVVK